MAVVQDEILDAFITELQEIALAKFRHAHKETQGRYERVRQLSMKLKEILDKPSEKRARQYKITWMKKIVLPVRSLTMSTCNGSKTAASR